MAKARFETTESASFWKNLKTGPLRMYFQHSGAKIRVFDQNTDIIEFFLTAREYFIQTWVKVPGWRVHMK